MAELERFLTAARLDAIGVFGYSDEDGTEAAGFAGKLDRGRVDAPGRAAHARWSRSSPRSGPRSGSASRSRCWSRRIDRAVPRRRGARPGPATEGRAARPAREVDGRGVVRSGRSAPGRRIVAGPTVRRQRRRGPDGRALGGRSPRTRHRRSVERGCAGDACRRRIDPGARAAPVAAARGTSPTRSPCCGCCWCRSSSLLLFHDDGHRTGWRVAACVVFAVASLTDRLDGELARRRGLVTDFGKIADPIADKALTGAALVGLSLLGELPWWVTVVDPGPRDRASRCCGSG